MRGVAGRSPDDADRPGDRDSGDPAETDTSVGELLAAIAGGSDGEDGRGLRDHGRLLGQLGARLASSARRASTGAVGSGHWLADQLVAAAPRLPVRDAATLSRHHRGLTGEALADSLVRTAARATAAVGVGGGAVAAAQWAAPMTLLTIPLQLAVEVLAVAAIEVKLVAELHEVYGQAVPGTGAQRGTAYAVAWATRRGVNPLQPATLSTALGLTARRRVQRRLMINAGRGIGTVTPFLAGAAFGAYANRRQTYRLADELRADLRARRPLDGSLAARVTAEALRAAPVWRAAMRRRGKLALPPAGQPTAPSTPWPPPQQWPPPPRR